MRHLLNTLYVTSEDIFLALDGENVVAKKGDAIMARYPLHTLQSIITFSYSGASPALMGACVEREICLSFCTPQGKFLARVNGISNGNVLLRKEQYRISDDEVKSCYIARSMIFGKLYNARWSVNRTLRDHKMRVNEEKLKAATAKLVELLHLVMVTESLDVLRGYEGSGAAAYFDVFDDMILRNKDDFFFRERNRRPPTDNVNAMLSFAYSLLANDCASGLESCGLDSYVGMLHRDRPGRKSLSLDLMEELRPCMADRFVLTVINNRILGSDDFKRTGSGAVYMTDEARKKFLNSWQEKKKEIIKHPYLEEKIPWGLVPFIQAQLLARYLRGDLDGYPVFLWK